MLTGLHFDMNDETELSDYMELSFQSLLCDNMTHIKIISYKIRLNISTNDTSKANININKRPRDNKDAILFLNKMFIDNVEFQQHQEEKMT